MEIKEKEVLERIGAAIDELNMYELAALHNYVVPGREPITGADIAPSEGWHLVPQEGAH